jgi:hypothetical protein
LLAPLAGRIYEHAPQQNAFSLGSTTAKVAMLAFPLFTGRFTEAEWYAVYRTSLSHEDALREARDLSGIDPSEAWRVSVSALDLAIMSLLSPNLERRVDDYLRDAQERLKVDPATMADIEAEWQRLRDRARNHLRQAEQG